MPTLSFDQYNKDLGATFQNTRHFDIGAILVALNKLFPKKRTIGDIDAQNIVKPYIERVLRLIQAEVSRHDALRWLCAFRAGMPSIDWFLTNHFQGSVHNHVPRMVFLSVIEFGNEDISGLPEIAWRGPNSGLANWEGISAEMLAPVVRLVHLCALLYGIETLYRGLARGKRISYSDSPRFNTTIAPGHERQLNNYDERIRYDLSNNGFLSGSGKLFLQTIEDSEGIEFFQARSLSSFMKNDLDRILELLQKIPTYAKGEVSFMLVMHELGNLRFLKEFPNPVIKRIQLTPEEIEACISAQACFVSDAKDNGRFVLQALAYGFIVVPIEEYKTKMKESIRATLRATEEEADRLLFVFLNSYQPSRNTQSDLYSTSFVHRYMTAFVGHVRTRNGSGIIIDFSDAERDLAGWLNFGTTDDGQIGTAIGKYFEGQWASRRLSRWTKDTPNHKIDDSDHVLQILKPHAEELYTDIDIAIRSGDWLYVADAKCKLAPDRVLRGETKSVRNRWKRLQTELKQWDDAMFGLFTDPAMQHSVESNTRLRELTNGAKFVVPILVTPRPEWVPSLDEKFILHPGWPKEVDGKRPPVLRICTMDELLRVVQSGGPPMVEKSKWLIRLQSS